MSDHLDVETLAELAEGALPPEAATELRKHLATCRSCTVAYADAVRYRAAWLAAPEMFVDSPVPVRELMAADRLAGSTPRASTARAGSRSYMFAVAACVVIGAGTFWALTLDRAPTLGFALPREVRTATEWSSARGLVLPGGERPSSRPMPTLRSGLAEPSPGVMRELDSLATAYEAGRPSPELAARLVTAFLAANDVRAARDYVREALGHDPRDVRLLVLSAAADYRTDDLSGAEQSLRRARQLAPRDPLVTFDLALVLREQGRADEERRLLEDVSRGWSPELVARAQRELQDR